MAINFQLVAEKGESSLSFVERFIRLTKKEKLVEELKETCAFSKRYKKPSVAKKEKKERAKVRKYLDSKQQMNGE
ncbi:hypothetical protein M0R19_04230 [Candidatus Pacearchaeota archaeon]|nr:hypothetical protein [Candidatus Pacearchaeota archaeon]